MTILPLSPFQIVGPTHQSFLSFLPHISLSPSRGGLEASRRRGGGGWTTGGHSQARAVDGRRPYARYLYIFSIFPLSISSSSSERRLPLPELEKMQRWGHQAAARTGLEAADGRCAHWRPASSVLSTWGRPLTSPNLTIIPRRNRCRWPAA